MDLYPLVQREFRQYGLTNHFVVEPEYLSFADRLHDVDRNRSINCICSLGEVRSLSIPESL